MMRQKLISAVLCLALLLNPIFFEMAVWAAEEQNQEVKSEALDESSTQADSAVAETNKADDQLSNTKKAKTKWYMSSSTKRKIRDANTKLDDAKGQVSGVKDDAEGVGDEVKGIGDTINGDGNAFDKMAGVAAGIQKALIKAGQLLQKIGKLLKTVGQALMAIGQVLSAIPWTAAIGKALTTVGKLLVKVGTVLDKVGQAIEKIGNVAKGADANFGEMLGNIGTAVKDGWSEGSAEADAYEQKLNEDAAKDAEGDEGGASETNDAAPDDGSGTVEDADQGVADI
ncbi:MAG: hypothetical protein CVV42_17730 [Candidatus Riflebacteria bacterium HGW-Riflebacteria-2]|jgi:hypothetical protein|nr:MAG: hypothetical protein CVV42_17730 [Candidatus Riflebacteria bacterium HGW-Riflebacteria-2]